jgi:hypothetical protein
MQQWPLWAQVLGFLGGGLVSGAIFLALAWRAERRNRPDGH